MRELLRFIFDMITDPLTLPISPIYEWLILAIVDLVAYRIAFDKVGDMYVFGIISSKSGGSLCHWIIRAIVFVLVWAFVYGIIALAQWAIAHWLLAVCVLTGLLLSGIVIYRIIKRRVNKEVAA